VETLASACKRVAEADRGEIAPLLNHGTVGMPAAISGYWTGRF
jgi:hypothetical protein